MNPRLKVFLSHSSADKVLARRLGGDLEKANVEVWLDQWEIGVGDDFTPSIEKGVDEATFVVVLLTRASVNTPWVTREWRRKVEHEFRTNRIAVLPVRGEACELPDFLAQRSHADISGGSYPLGLRHLLTLLRYYSDAGSIRIPDSTIVKKRISEDMYWMVAPIALEVGSDLIPLFAPGKDGSSRFLDDLAPAMREALREEYGFRFPGIRVRGNEAGMPSRSAVIMIDEVSELTLEVGRDDVLVDATVPELAALGIAAEQRRVFAPCRSCSCIAPDDREAVRTAGFLTWDAAEYIVSVLQNVVGGMAEHFLDPDVARLLVESYAEMNPAPAARAMPQCLSWFELTDILKRLVDEKIAIGDIGRILDAVTQRQDLPRDTVLLTEQARHALRGQITAKFDGGRDSLLVLAVDPAIEALIRGSLQHTPAGTYFSLEPHHVQSVLDAVGRQIQPSNAIGMEVPLLVMDSEVRLYLRKIVERDYPRLEVLSRQDLEPELRIQIMASIGFPQSSDASLPRQE